MSQKKIEPASLLEQYTYYTSLPNINKKNPKIIELFSHIKKIIEDTSSQIDEQKKSIYDVWKEYKKNLNKTHKEEKEAFDIMQSIQSTYYNKLKMQVSALDLERKQAEEKHFQALLSIAEQEGNSFAKLMVGHMYLTGNTVEINYEKAIEWYNKSALLKNIDAIHGLACMYEDGIAPEKYYKQALEYYQKDIVLRNRRFEKARKHW